MNLLPIAMSVPAVALWVLALSSPLFRIDIGDVKRHHVPIDGLRGFLAVGVFMHHFALTALWQSTGVWSASSAHAWDALGPLAVTLFFMITGLLFFERIGDPSRKSDVFGFLKARALRIYPVYVACLVFVLIVAAISARSSFDIKGTWRALFWWLAFCPTGLFGMKDAGFIVAYTPWSLKYEALFYFALPLLALAWRVCKFDAAFPVGLAVLALCLAQWPQHVEHAPAHLDTRYIAPFMLGGVVVPFLRCAMLRRLLGGRAGSTIVLAALFYLLVKPDPYSPEAYLVAATAFIPIALGADLFGLLRTPGMLVLGAISYDIYLLHGIVLFIGFRLLLPDALLHMSWFGLFCTMVATGFVSIAFSLATHIAIEKPTMSRSKRLRRNNLHAGLQNSATPRPAMVLSSAPDQ